MSSQLYGKRKVVFIHKWDVDCDWGPLSFNVTCDMIDLSINNNLGSNVNSDPHPNLFQVNIIFPFYR